VGLDLQAHYRSRLGVTKVYGELAIAENMDRGLFVADPVLAGGLDFRELGGYVGVVQELGPYAVVGFRYDTYDPNSDAFDKRGGKYLPFNQTVTTYAPLAGFILPDRAKLLFEYDVYRNHFGRDASGVPTNLKANFWTVRLQVQL
jgi:hypothetical protein